MSKVFRVWLHFRILNFRKTTLDFQHAPTSLVVQLATSPIEHAVENNLGVHGYTTAYKPPNSTWEGNAARATASDTGSKLSQSSAESMMLCWFGALV